MRDRITASTAVRICIVGGLLLFAAASCSSQSDRTRVGDQASKMPAEKEAMVQNGAMQPEAAVIAHEPKEEEPRFVANPFCGACHADFIDDKLARRHESAGIGCERCHGESERHRSDEANLTPPEIMYPRDKINPTCMMCHPRQDIRHVRMHDAILEGAATIFDEQAEQADGPEKVCTDCHGRGHRMEVRTVRWNKATGEVISE